MKRAALGPALAVATGLAFAAFSPAAAQETGTFTLTQGDTEVATEWFSRTDSELETELEITGQGIMATDASLSGDDTVDRVELRLLPADDPDGEPTRSTAAEFRGDSVYFEQPIGTSAGAMSAASGTVPYLNPSPSYMEQILRRARELGGTDVMVQVWIPSGGGQVASAQVTFDGENNATLLLGNAAVQVRTDAEGRFLGGEIPDQGLVIERNE